MREGLKVLKDKVKPLEVVHEKIEGPIQKGDTVRMAQGEVTGIVLSIKGKKAVVQFGDLRSNVKTEQLVRSAAQRLVKQGNHASSGIHIHQRQSTFSALLDIRGKRVEEVFKLLERFMDDAILTGQHEVKILHGKGEGVLRKVVREYLAEI